MPDCINTRESDIQIQLIITVNYDDIYHLVNFIGDITVLKKDWISLSIVLPFILQNISFSYWHTHSTEKIKPIPFPFPLFNIFTGIWEESKTKMVVSLGIIFLLMSVLLFAPSVFKLWFQQLLVASWAIMKFQALSKILRAVQLLTDNHLGKKEKMLETPSVLL